jgi:hypothetical protein
MTGTCPAEGSGAEVIQAAGPSGTALLLPPVPAPGGPYDPPFVIPEWATLLGRGKRNAGRLLDGPRMGRIPAGRCDRPRRGY